MADRKGARAVIFHYYERGSSPCSVSSASLSVIQSEESTLSLQNGDERSHKKRKQKSQGKPQIWTWAPRTSSPSIPTPFCLQLIMNEEEERRRETRRLKKKPLQFVTAEEQAMSELLLLYQQSFGEDVVVNVERCTVDAQEPIWAQ